MKNEILTICCNAAFPEDVMQRLHRETAPHRLLLSTNLESSNLVAGQPDAALAEADIAFGQPDPVQIMQLNRLRWVHLNSAGYTRYDRADLRKAMQARAAALTNSSWVYAEPCAQHVMAMMFSLARRLPQCWAEQRGDRGWRAAEHRAASQLLVGQMAILYGYGAIARRLAELLAPLRMSLHGVRRTIRGDETIPTIPTAEADSLLGSADHVVNILPAAAETGNYFHARRFSLMKRGAIFYNIGRGTTVDQEALRVALVSGHLSAAYLDVTSPEPLPPTHALWNAPNCYIAPHTAGGHAQEFDRLAEHFLNNLRRFEAGEALLDRVV